MKKKYKVFNIVVFIIGVLVVSFTIFFIFKKEEPKKLIDFKGMTLEEVLKYANENKITINKTFSNDDTILKNYVISQSVLPNTKLTEGQVVDIVVSIGPDYAKYKVDELGFVPIMMYHGIHDKKNSETEYTGGNIDYAGYQRTTEAFRNDLEFYYKEGYRMIRLNDYINGIVDVGLGKSPIVLTFDDGLENNIKVTGLDSDGNIIIDPNSAVGILEEFKKKYPDFNVTATFFVNGGLFNQKEYNEKILNWLVNNGYDVGNHAYSHPDFTKISGEASIKEVGSVYKMLDEIIPGKYVKIVAMPFGSPYSTSHENFKHIMSGNYNGYEYETESALRVGWESEKSPYSSSFDKMFLKRIRAYDNNGKEFDIEMNFERLKDTRYVSDGNKDTITILDADEKYLGETYNLEVIKY